MAKFGFETAIEGFFDEAERRITAEQERSAILEKRLVEMTSQKADAVEALERETAATRAQTKVKTSTTAVAAASGSPCSAMT